MAYLTGWQTDFLGNASLAATLLMPSDAAVRAFLLAQACCGRQAESLPAPWAVRGSSSG